MKLALTHFQTADPILYAAGIRLQLNRVLKKEPQTNYFARLVDNIIGQQLSERVSSVIFQRFMSLLPDKQLIPETVSKLTIDQMRSAGMSNAKANYVHNLAEAVRAGQLHFGQYSQWDNEEIITDLIQVKGIGRWTAEMFLMFTMGRPDVFSWGDLGLKNAIRRLYQIDYQERPKVERIVVKWSPYRTYACLILWGTLSFKD